VGKSPPIDLGRKTGADLVREGRRELGLEDRSSTRRSRSSTTGPDATRITATGSAGSHRGSVCLCGPGRPREV